MTELLNGGINGRVGLAKSFTVSPGDEISATAFVKYMNLGANLNATAFLTGLASAFGVSASSTGEQLKIYNGLGGYAASVPLGDHPEDDEIAPKSFITILLFDRNYNLVDATWDQVTTACAQTSTTVKQPPLHDNLIATYKVLQPGHAYIFISNENPKYVDVYFDDVTITHLQSPVVGGADYYPFGLVMDGMEITDEKYRYGYQGQYAEKNDSTGWNEFELRMYDARFGRWLSVDPAGQYASPYVGMGNTPNMSIDPDGGFNVGATLIGSGVGFTIGSAVGLLVDKDHWLTFGLIGAAAGGIAGASSGNITIDSDVGFFRKTFAEMDIAVNGSVSRDVVAKSGSYAYGPGVSTIRDVANVKWSWGRGHMGDFSNLVGTFNGLNAAFKYKAIITNYTFSDQIIENQQGSFITRTGSDGDNSKYSSDTFSKGTTGGHVRFAPYSNKADGYEYGNSLYFLAFKHGGYHDHQSGNVSFPKNRSNQN